jgi:quinol monooxygenase YgiN
MPNPVEVVLIAEATALPGKRDELKKAIDELIPKSLAEDGIRTGCTKTVNEAGHFMLYELFDSRVAIDSHFATQHFAKITAAVAELTVDGKPKITYYEKLTD